MNFKKVLKEIFFSFVWIFPLFYAVDVVTKVIIMNNQGYISSQMSTHTFNTWYGMSANPGIILIPGFLSIAYSENENIVFGLGEQLGPAGRYIYMAISITAAVVIIVSFILKYKKLNKLIRASLMLILVGALGNLTDRLFYSKANYNVVDWIDFFGIWPFIFNIADSCVVIAAFILIIYMIVSEIKEYKKKKQTEYNSLDDKSDKKILSKEEIERLNNKD